MERLCLHFFAEVEFISLLSKTGKNNLQKERAVLYFLYIIINVDFFLNISSFKLALYLTTTSNKRRTYGVFK